MLGEPASDDPAAVRGWIAAITAAATTAPGSTETPTPEEKDNTAMNDNNSAVLDLEIDKRGLPDSFRRKRYLRAIKQLFDDRDIATEHRDRPGPGGVRDRGADPGQLLRPGESRFRGRLRRRSSTKATRSRRRPQTDPSRPSFFTSRNGLRLRKLDVYLQVYKELLIIKAQQAPTVQELAAVSDEVLERGPVDDNLPAKVRSAFDDCRRSRPRRTTPSISRRSSPRRTPRASTSRRTSAPAR